MTASAAVAGAADPVGGSAGRRDAVLWRSSRNPIIARDLIPRANSIFNSAVVPFRDGFAGVFRVDDTRRAMNIHAGRSADGIDWEIDHEPIPFEPTDERVPRSRRPSCTRTTRASPGSRIATTSPGATAITARRSASRTRTTSRPSTSSTTRSSRSTATACSSRAGSAAATRCSAARATTGTRRSATSTTRRARISCTGARHRHVLAPVPSTWQSTKVGAGPTPIETSEGWLVLYHGVLTSCNGFVYSMGAALLDLDEPWKVLARGRDYLLAPQALYEQVGDVPNVVFPCAALVEHDADRISDLLRRSGHGRLPGARPPLRDSRLRQVLSSRLREWPRPSPDRRRKPAPEPARAAFAPAGRLAAPSGRACPPERSRASRARGTAPPAPRCPRP